MKDLERLKLKVDLLWKILECSPDTSWMGTSKILEFKTLELTRNGLEDKKDCITITESEYELLKSE